MSLKKGFIENYFKERERPKTDLAINNSVDEVSKYSHNRVFDEPESLKKVIAINSLNNEEKIFYPEVEKDQNKFETNLKQHENNLTKRKFKKSNYRPWNFLEELEKEEELAFGDLGDKNNLEIYQKKLEPNLSQSRAKLEPQLESNLRQSKVKLEPNLSQSRVKLRTQLEPQLEPNLSQCRAKLKSTPLLSESFFSLIGLQRKILIFIHNQCKICRDKVTFPLSIENIATHCNTTFSSARKALQRLEKKQFIIRKEFKNGRGGWTRYELPNNTFQELMQYENYGQTQSKLEPNLSQSRAKLRTQLEPQLEPSSLSSSSNKIDNINTTTTALPESWSNLDFSIGQQFGFTNSHLIQLYKHGGIEAKMIQESIQHFAFDLEKNNKIKEIKTNPLSYFMGILKRVGAYAPPDNYESPKEEAMRIYLEKKKLLESKREVMEKEFLELSFKEWLNTLTENEIDHLIPYDVKKLKLEAPKKAALRTHFEKTIWVFKKVEMMNDILDCKNDVYTLK